jgi:hypothetical protein
VSGFQRYPTDVLLRIRRNLLAGLDRVAEHAAAGTLHVIPEGKSSPPIQAGQLTLILLNAIDAELADPQRSVRNDDGGRNKTKADGR